MVRFIIRSLVVASCCALLCGCIQDAPEDLQPKEDNLDLSNLDLSNLNLSGLNLGLDQTFDFGHDDRKKLGLLSRE